MILLNTIKRELDALGIKPKKSLGQNFLINEGIYKKIVAALEIKKNDTIVEVGPGLGTLTGYLAESGAKVIAVEKDHRLIDWLKKKFEISSDRIRVIEDDILKLDVKKLGIKENDYKVVGNIPYYITSRLIRNILEDWPLPKSVVLMVQKEVAQRICAKPPGMSLLALSVRYYTTPKIVSYVSSGNFMPPPDVDSAIIKFSEFKIHDRESGDNLFKIAKAGFSSKRKQLINNLATGLKISKQEIQQKLSLIDINPRRRAETLTIEEWQKITDSLFSQD